jgi:hypothetical protein
MAIRGQEGSVKFKNSAATALAVAGVQNWSFTEEKETYETTKLGDTAKTFIGGLTSGSGSLEMLYEAPGAASGAGEIILEALTASDPADAAFELYSQGSTYKITFSGIVTSVDFGATLNEVQTCSINFQASGAITNALTS